MSKQKDLFGKDIKEQPSREKEPRQPEECKICRHCGYIPEYDDFYCWTLEGLCTDVLDYCKENRCYEPSIDKLDIIDILGRKFKRIESDKKNFVRKGIAELELEKAMACKECYWSHVDYLKCIQKGKCNYFIYFRFNAKQKIIMVEKAWVMLYKEYISKEQFSDVIEAIVHGGQNDLKWNIIKLALSELNQLSDKRDD